MKRSVAWHVEDVNNASAYARRLREEARSKLIEADRVHEEALFHTAQVEQAIAQNKDGFDEDRFLKNKIIYFRNIVRDGIVYAPVRSDVRRTGRMDCVKCAFHNTPTCIRHSTIDRPVDCWDDVFYVVEKKNNG
jgi:hypothetical protein